MRNNHTQFIGGGFLKISSKLVLPHFLAIDGFIEWRTVD